MLERVLTMSAATVILPVFVLTTQLFPAPVQAQDVLVHIALEWDSRADLLDFTTVYESVVETVSNGNWQAQGDDGPMRWEGEAEYGYVAWDEKRKQVHVIIATDEQAVEAAAAGLPL